MTRLLKIFACLLTLCSFFACQQQTPEEVQLRHAAQGYLDAMANYRIEEARNYASEETCEGYIKFCLNVVMPNLDSNARADIAANTPATVKLGDITYTSDSTATIAFVKRTPKKKQDGTLNMIKREGEWRAHLLVSLPPIVSAAARLSQDSLTDEDLQAFRRNHPNMKADTTSHRRRPRK